MITLATELARIRGLTPNFLGKLGKLGIRTVRDLLWHFPARYEDFSRIVPIAELEVHQAATIRGVVRKVDLRRTWRRKMVLVEAVVADDTGAIKAIWFNQPYVARALRPGMRAAFAGRVAPGEDEPYLSSPLYEPIRPGFETRHTAGLIPIYPETRGLTSKGIRYLVAPILKVLPAIEDPLPPPILQKFQMPAFPGALRMIHFPRAMAEAEAAKRRFAFENLYLLQLVNLRARSRLAEERAHAVALPEADLGELLAALPFALTPSQERSMREILADLGRSRPMNRLLQGDVGSGKTVVAAIAAIAAARAGFQAAFMAPTEVLARQHHETFQKIFERILGEWGIAVELLVSGIKRAERALRVAQIASGATHIVIGTHALIEEDVRFRNLAFVIVDEQHRFGVEQRASLVARGQARTEERTIADTPESLRGETAAEPDILLHRDTTYKIRGCMFAVRKKLGLGHKESIYQKALAEEFFEQGLSFEREKSIRVMYNDKPIGTYRPDFIVAEKIIVELKAIPFITKAAENQFWTYLKGSSYEVGLLVNFGGEDVEIKRLVHSRSPRPSVPSPRQSASSQRSSAVLPHFLSMSATPIPRTLSLTLFGDLDLSIIDELPKGRKPIVTRVVAPLNREKAYAFVREQITKGRQAFVICPRIEPGTQTNADGTQTNADEAQTCADTDSMPRDAGTLFPRSSASRLRRSAWEEVKAVKDEYEKLRTRIFPDLTLAMLHGKLKSRDKERIMAEFKNGKAQMLVATSVVEVGVDVPNATVMMIEGADRFGLSQLYQFRGRIGRGEHQSFCLLFTDSNSESVGRRLQALLRAKNGFELAEEDLKIRGPGQFLGERQTGLPDLAMRSLGNLELVREARAAAEATLAEDRALAQYPLLASRLEAFTKEVHLE